MIIIWIVNNINHENYYFFIGFITISITMAIIHFITIIPILTFIPPWYVTVIPKIYYDYFKREIIKTVFFCKGDISLFFL